MKHELEFRKVVRELNAMYKCGWMLFWKKDFVTERINGMQAIMMKPMARKHVARLMNVLAMG